jgi:hydrogenase maturation protein HypF
MHNREIYARYDDSVWFVPDPDSSSPLLSGPQPIRRSRGYAPFPIQLTFDTTQTLATGPELKNTFCLTRDNFAFLSQHIGDMENLETLEHFETSIDLYKHLFRVQPREIAYDLHPGYFSTKYAHSQASSSPSPTLIPIQHHEAHIAACLTDNGWPLDGGPVIGVAWDGTGYGRDGHIWGGEFFVGDYVGFRRAAQLEYLPMPGGEAAIHNPWRLALGYVYALTGELPELSGIREQERRIVRQQVERRLNTPLTSAAGRLFDAVAALIGIRQKVTYEAQAAIEMEMLATRWRASSLRSASTSQGLLPAFPFDIEPGEQGHIVRLGPLFQALQASLAGGTSPAEIGWRFHLTMAELILRTCQLIAGETTLRTVALSGGCFQNRLLLTLVVPRLEQAGFQVLLHHQVPCNDGGVSLGQASLAHLHRQEEQP